MKRSHSTFGEHADRSDPGARVTSLDSSPDTDDLVAALNQVALPDSVAHGSMSLPVVVGIDSGGTWLRVVAYDLQGHPVRRVTERGGRAEAGVDLIGIAVPVFTECLHGLRVLAAAATNAVNIQDAWRAARVGGPPLTTMSEAVLAAVPTAASAVVVIAGTGSAAATVLGGCELLVTGGKGDAAETGCGTWLGRQAALAVRDGRLADPWATQITETVKQFQIDVGSPKVAGLAPVVTAAAAAGDQWALSVCEQAAQDLAALLDVHDVNRFAPTGIVTVGSVISPSTPVGVMFQAHATRRGVTVAQHLPDLTGRAVEWAAAGLAARYPR